MSGNGKLERWRKISATNTQSKGTEIKPEKAKLLTELSTVSIPIVEEKNEEVGVKSIPQEYTDDSGVQSRSTVNTPSSEVKQSSKRTPRKDTKKQETSSDSGRLAARVNKNIVTEIQSKVTQDDTHKKTSMKLTYVNLARLENYVNSQDNNRIKGMLMNFLLEEFFQELIDEDPRWKDILDHNLEEIIEQLKGNKKRMNF